MLSLPAIICCVIIVVFGSYLIYLDYRNNTLNTKYLNQNTQYLFKKTDMIYVQCNRVFGRYFDKPVLLLVDTGANANFISEKFIESVYPQYNQYVLFGDDVMSVSGTMTLNKVLDIPLHIQPDGSLNEQFTLLQDTDTFDYLSSETDQQVVGIIGTGLLKKLNMCIDFKRL
jgi:hypothetical protein